MSDSFDWNLEGVLNSGVKLGTLYMEMETADEKAKSDEALMRSDQIRSDILYNAQATIPANQRVASDNNLINSWNTLDPNFKLMGGVVLLISIYFMVK